MPAQLSASLSRDMTWESDKAEAWCPQVAAAYADPVNSFRAFLQIEASLEILLMRYCLVLFRRVDN